MAQSTSRGSTNELWARENPVVKSHQPTNTATNRPRPKASQNEGRHFLEKVRPQDKGVLGKAEPALSADEEVDNTGDAVTSARIKASYE